MCKTTKNSEETPIEFSKDNCHPMRVMNKTIQEYTETELKALGFEIKNELERLQLNLQIINQELQKRQQSNPEDGTKNKPKSKSVSG